jgi:hypothetical protein
MFAPKCNIMNNEKDPLESNINAENPIYYGLSDFRESNSIPEKIQEYLKLSIVA